MVVGLKTLQMYIRILFGKNEARDAWPCAAQRLAAVGTVFQAGDLRAVAADKNVVFLECSIHREAQCSFNNLQQIQPKRSPLW